MLASEWLRFRPRENLDTDLPTFQHEVYIHKLETRLGA
jgi:hypothetical protein